MNNGVNRAHSFEIVCVAMRLFSTVGLREMESNTYLEG